VLANVFPSGEYATAIVLLGGGANGQYLPATRRSASDSAHRLNRPLASSSRVSLDVNAFAFVIVVVIVVLAFAFVSPSHERDADASASREDSRESSLADSRARARALVPRSRSRAMRNTFPDVPASSARLPRIARARERERFEIRKVTTFIR
tara:strand:+ start:2996 stop:3451 length:456 start_codon:yes stop_codon:yes gene_type:complete